MALQLKRLFAYIENLRIGWLGIFLIANAVGRFQVVEVNAVCATEVARLTHD